MLTSIYYLLSVLCVLIALVGIVSIKDSKDLYERISYLKKNKNSELSLKYLKKVTNKYTSSHPHTWTMYVFSKFALTTHFIWLFFGIITPQWWIFISIISILLIAKVLYKNRFPNKSRGIVNLFILFLYLFLIINHFNLGIDLSFNNIFLS